MSTTVTPAWFEAPRREVGAALAAGRLAHGMLIHEDPGAGGLEFARWIAQLVNCRDAKRAPCGECQECRWVAADQHPDVTRLSPEEDSTQIKVDAVRALIADLTLTAHGAGYKVAILSPAHAMTEAAANALLKTLEEPRASHAVAAGDQPAGATAGHRAQPLYPPATQRTRPAEAPRNFSKPHAARDRGARRWRPPAPGRLRCSTRIRRRWRSCAPTRWPRSMTSAAAIFSRPRWPTAGRAATLRRAWPALRAGSQNASSNPRQSAT